MEAKKELTESSIPDAPLERSNGLLGTDELNLCEFPLAACGHRSTQNAKTLTFEDDIFDDGNQQPVHRKLVIAASDVFGLPTPADSDVLLVLMHLTRTRNKFSSPTVRFTRYELVKFLGWDVCGRSYRRLEESLNRWASVTLYYNRAWWDKDGKSWRSRTFHVLETVDLRGREVRRDDSESSFTWNQVIFQSFLSNNIRRLDLNTYFSLQLPAAKQAYRFLDKRFYRSRTLELELRKFACEHVGLSRNYDNSQLRRKLQPAIEELEKIGFLKPMSSEERYRQRKRGEWEIALVKSSKSVAAECDAQEPASNLAAQLVERGVQATVAADLVAQYPAEKIEEKIELHDCLMQKRDGRTPRNPAGFLNTAIRKDFPLPPELRRKAEKQAATAAKPIAKIDRTIDLAAERSRKRREAAKQSLSQLSAEELAVFQAKALENGDASLLKTYSKESASAPKGPMAEMALRELLILHAIKEAENR